MRIWGVYVALGIVVAGGWAQSAAPPESLFDTLRPQISVVVREHATSADLVEITVLDPEYPPELLSEQARRVGESTGSPSRGVQIATRSIDEQNPRLAFLKATFATDHLIDRAQGVLRLTPIVRAFAGAPEPYAVTALSVMFDGEVPTAAIVRTFQSAAVVVEGRATTSPPGIEYRIRLLSQDVQALSIPERADAAPISRQSQTNGPSRTVLIALCALAAVAAGALVYLALLRNPRGGPK